MKKYRLEIVFGFLIILVVVFGVQYLSKHNQSFQMFIAETNYTLTESSDSLLFIAETTINSDDYERKFKYYEKILNDAKVLNRLGERIDEGIFDTTDYHIVDFDEMVELIKCEYLFSKLHINKTNEFKLEFINSFLNDQSLRIFDYYTIRVTRENDLSQEEIQIIFKLFEDEEMKLISAGDKHTLIRIFVITRSMWGNLGNRDKVDEISDKIDKLIE